MATARCYTKSGSVEKYESNLWSMESDGVAVTITGPDSRGNYTVTPPSGYEDSNTPTEFYCTTIYGGIKKTFYFKEIIHYIYLSSGIKFSGVGLNVYLYFTNNEYLGNDKLSVRVEITANNPLVLIDSVFFTVGKDSKSPLKLVIEVGSQQERRYKAEIKDCRPMSGDNYQVSILQQRF